MRPASRLTWLAILATIAVAGCGSGQSWRCSITNIPADLGSGDAATRGAAAECAMNAAPERIAEWIPALLPLLTDTIIFRRYESGGGLIGFGEAGTREVSVAMPALRAVQRAQPTQRNVAAIVDALVDAANQVRPNMRSSAQYGEPESIAQSLIELLATSYHVGPLRDSVTAEIRAASTRVRNLAFWRDEDFARELSALYDAHVPYPWDGSARPPAQWVSRMPADLATPVAAAQAAADAEPRRERPKPRGLTWGVLQTNKLAEHWLYVACDGTPDTGMTHPRVTGACDPYTGDTSCEVLHPVLCRHAISATQLQEGQQQTAAEHRERVVGLEYATTHAVRGDSLESQQAADAVCAAHFGTGWRMAEHHDLERGWGAIGRDAGVAQGTRFWVAINDQPANCWD